MDVSLRLSQERTPAFVQDDENLRHLSSAHTTAWAGSNELEIDGEVQGGWAMPCPASESRHSSQLTIGPKTICEGKTLSVQEH